jgi:hypothetical protein
VNSRTVRIFENQLEQKRKAAGTHGEIERGKRRI